MDDPTTVALNLTFFGTLGVAFVMFLGLGVIAVLTLILAGLARLASLILLALVGFFPKRDTVDIVRLPSPPEHAPAASEGPEDAVPEDAVPGSLSAAGLFSSEEPRPSRLQSFFVTVSAWFEAVWSSVLHFQWKSALDPKKLPKPSELKTAVSAHIEAGVETQAKHHPIVVAAKQEPQAMDPKWAAAVAAADERAAARAKAAEPPEIIVTVRDLPPAQAPAEEIEKVAPLVESAVDPHGPKKARPGAKVTSGSKAGSMAASSSARPRA